MQSSANHLKMLLVTSASCLAIGSHNKELKQVKYDISGYKYVTVYSWTAEVVGVTFGDVMHVDTGGLDIFSLYV